MKARATIVVSGRYVFSEGAMGKRSRGQRRSLPVSFASFRRTGNQGLSLRKRTQLPIAPLITRQTHPPPKDAPFLPKAGVGDGLNPEAAGEFPIVAFWR